MRIDSFDSQNGSFMVLLYQIIMLSYPEQQAGDEFLCQFFWKAHVAVQLGVHHAWVYSVHRHCRASRLELLMEAVGEQELRQFTSCIRGMRAIILPSKKCRETDKSLTYDINVTT